MSKQMKDLIERFLPIPILGYEDKYLVSDLGRVKSLYFGKEKILRPWKINGYYFIGLRNDKKRKRYAVHRLVALAFIGNPFEGAQINHKNGVKDDNRVENLEWVTPKENARHAIENGLLLKRGKTDQTFQKRLFK